MSAGWHGRGMALLALGAVLWTFSCLLSVDRIPAYRDLLFFVVPIKYFLAEELRHFEIPLWNPYIQLGTPFLAGLQTAVLYPLSLILIVPFPVGLNCFFLAHYFVAQGGMWALLRYRGMSPASSAIGSLSFAIGGYLVSMLNVTSHLQAAVWAPWLLLAWAKYRDRPGTRRWLVLITLISIQVLAGAPEVLLMTLGILVAWTACTSFPRMRDLARLETMLVAAFAFALALTALQILPTVEYLLHSARRGPLEFTETTAWSLEPVSLLQLLFPHSSSLQPPWNVKGLGYRLERIAPWIRSIYLGVAPLCLAIVGLTNARDRRFWGTILFTGLLLALGKHTPIFSILYRSLPAVFAKFRYPEKFYFLIALAVAILAAEGAQEVLRGSRSARRLALTAAFTLFAIAVAVLVVRSISPTTFVWLVEALTKGPNQKLLAPLSADLALKCNRLALIAGAFLALGVLGGRGLLAPATLATMLVALVGADLATINNDLNLSISWSEINARPPPVDSATLQQTHGRIFLYQTVGAAGEGLEPVPIEGIDEWSGGATEDSNLEEFYEDAWTALLANRAMMVHVDAIGGADGIQRDSSRALREALSRLPRERALKVLKILSCAYLVGPTPLEVAELERVSREALPSVFTYRINDPLPVAYLASYLRVVPSDPRSLDTLGSIDFRAGNDALVEELPPGWQNSQSVSSPGAATLLARDRELTRVRVVANRPALLVSNDSYYPGWEATVDGSPAKMYKTNGMVRGVVVAPGDRIVEFRYHPRAWFMGSCISGVALVTFLLIGLFGSTRRQSEMLGER